MANLRGFDASSVPPSEEIGALPNGTYTVAVTDSEMRPPKSGDGEMLVLTYTVLEGEHRNRKVWDYLCLQHSDPDTVKYARSNLSAICHAVGVLRPDDSSDLHGIPFQIRVKSKPDAAGVPRNSVAAYQKLPQESHSAPPPQRSYNPPKSDEYRDTYEQDNAGETDDAGQPEMWG